MSRSSKNETLGRTKGVHVFWRVIAGTVVGIIVLVAALNLIVDPFSLYGTHLLPRVEVNQYERKLDLFRQFEPRSDVLILGSSRILAYDPDVVEELTGGRCFNFSVPSAKAETFYAMLRIAIDDYDAPVDTVIVGVDPESFHPTMPIQPESRYVPDYAQYYIHDTSGQASFIDRIGLLLTLDQTIESIDSLRRTVQARTGRAKMEFRDDGFSTWVQLQREIEEGTFDLHRRLEMRVRRYPERSLELSEFDELGEVRKRYWEDFLEICADRGIRVYAFLPPVHPELLDLFHSVGADRILGEVSDYLEMIVVANGGVYRDYTDIRSFGGDPELFYDEIHMRPQNGEVLLRDLLGE